MARAPKRREGVGLFDEFEVEDLGGYDPDSPIPPGEWPSFSPEKMKVEFICPMCKYEWCGAPKPVDDIEE